VVLKNMEDTEMINNDLNGNPFLNIGEPKAWGPGSFEMAKFLVEAGNLK
jgi:hypothetical protein